MKKYKLFLVFSLIIKLTIGQDFECQTLQEQVTLKSATCTDWNLYDPVDPFDTPIKNVRITFHIIQKSDGTGNFPDNSTSRNWLQNMLMQSLNSKYGNFEPMNLPTSSPAITDCRIRFTLANIYFWQDDNGWRFQWGFGDSLYNAFVINQSAVSYKNNSVHVFMSENDIGHGQASGIGDKKWITLAGVYTRYLANNHWLPTNLLAHELGHSLGLSHTWAEDDKCNDTPYNPNCWNVNDTSGCPVPSNNLMDYNASQCAVTICQINRMHNFLLGNSNISDCLINTVTVQTPILNGSDLICLSGVTYTIDNLQLGVAVQGSTSPHGLFSFGSRCGNELTFSPSSYVVSGVGQITYTFDWIDYGIRAITKDVWVGKATQLNLCEFNNPIYYAGTINSPGSLCQPMSAIIESGNFVTLIGDEVNLNGGFEVELGGILNINVNSGCN